MQKKQDLATELCQAVRQDDSEAVERILAAGADVDSIGDNRITSVTHREGSVLEL